MSKFHYKVYVFSLAMVLGGVAFGQPSTRLRLTQIQDAPDTTSAYFIVAGQGDTILYKADIVSIDSTGRVFTVVIGTDTIRWEDTTGSGSGNIYTTNGSISGGTTRIVAIENDALNSLEFRADSAAASASYFTVWMYDPGFTTYHSRIQTTRSGTYIRAGVANPCRIDILDSGLDIERSGGAGTFTITDNATTATGIQYAADYSANYTSRSLVDKAYADAAGGGAFSTTSNVTSNSPGTLATDDFVFGSAQLGDSGNSAHDSRIIFDKSAGAFRAGSVTGTQWDSGSRGNYSSGFGINTTASALYSFAANNGNTASGTSSASFGNSNTATASYTFTAGGSGNDATATGAITLGGATLTASANYAVAAGSTATSDKRGQFSISGGPGFSGQYSFLTAGVEITGTASAVLGLDGSSGTPITIPSSTSWYFEVEAVAVIDVAGTGGTVAVAETAAYKIRGVLVNNAGTTSLSTSTAEYTYEPASMAGATFVATGDNTTDSLILTFDPDNTAWAADTVTRIMATIRFTQVGF